MDSSLSKLPHKPRFATLDIARMVCIILVVIGHYDPVDAPAHYNNMRMIIYSFHMPLLFVLSGLVAAASWERSAGCTPSAQAQPAARSAVRRIQSRADFFIGGPPL